MGSRLNNSPSRRSRLRRFSWDNVMAELGSVAVREHWSSGVLPASEPALQYSITPTLHFSITPTPGNKKGTPDISGRPRKIGIAYFAPRMASFAALATRNFTTRLAGTVIF